MRSFRLFVGERSYLTTAGWASLGISAVITGTVGYLCAAWLTDLFGPWGVVRTVAACGVGTWLLALIAFRAAGFHLIARLPDDNAARIINGDARKE